MSDTTLVVAAPAAAPTPTADATAAPVDGAFTALLAAALGPAPATAATPALPVGDASAAGVPADVGGAVGAGPADGDGGVEPAGPAGAAGGHAGAGAGNGPAGQTAPVAAVVPDVVREVEAVPVGDRPVVTDAAATTSRTAAVPPGRDAAPLRDGIGSTAPRGTVTAPATPPATLPPTDRPAAAASATGAGDTPGPAPTTTSSTAPAPAAVEPVGAVEAPRRASADPGTASPTPVAAAADVPGPAAPAPTPAGGSDLHARLVARVMDALDVLENAPPPRRLTVDLPDADGLRLHVSLRGGEVHVSLVGGGSGGDLSGWTRDLTEALAARGFSLGGSGAGAGQGERRQPGDDGQPHTDQPSGPRPRARPRVTDQALRL